MLARMDHDFVVRGDRRDPRPLSAAEVDAAVDRLAGSDLNMEAVADPASAGVTELRVRLSGPRSAGLVDAHRLAATLGWELYDPRRDWCWRDAGPVPPGFAADLPPGPGRRRTRCDRRSRGSTARAPRSTSSRSTRSAWPGRPR